MLITCTWLPHVAWTSCSSCSLVLYVMFSVVMCAAVLVQEEQHVAGAGDAAGDVAGAGAKQQRSSCSCSNGVWQRSSADMQCCSWSSMLPTLGPDRLQRWQACLGGAHVGAACVA